MACDFFHKPCQSPPHWLDAPQALARTFALGTGVKAWAFIQWYSRTDAATVGGSMRRLVLGLVLLLTMGDSCNNGVVGNQDYGGVTGRVLDATTNRPIANAIVSVGSLFVVTADAQGAFMLPHVPVGLQVVTARMPGFTTDSTTLRVKKDLTAQAGFLRLVSVTKPDAVPTLPPPATPTPEVSIEPTYVPPGYTPSPGPTAAVTGSPAAVASPAPTTSASMEP
jgi:Carboxypeptidase regulatory-like domain